MINSEFPLTVMCMSLDKLEYLDRNMEELLREMPRVEIDTTTFAFWHQVSNQLFKNMP